MVRIGRRFSLPAEEGRTRRWRASSIATRAQAGLAFAAQRAAADRRAARRPPAAALAVRAAQDRPAADRAAGSAHRRRHPRHRNLFRTLRLRRQGRGLRQPLDLRDRAAVGRMGGRPAGLWLAAPSARRRIRRSPAPMRARWSTNGSRCRAPGIRSPGGPTCCRGASFRGSARRLWCCRTPTCASIAASCAAWCVRCVISATPRATPAAASRVCRPRSR